MFTFLPSEGDYSLSISDTDALLDRALREDLGERGDMTSHILISEEKKTSYRLVSKGPLVLCGTLFVERLFARTDPASQRKWHQEEGEYCAAAPFILMEGRGSARILLAIERTLLNIVQHLSGIATLTHHYVKEIAHTKARILDTRKTLPGLRLAQKYAVRMGGGLNHRLRLEDSILIKDNHISLCHGDIVSMVQKIRQATPILTRIEVECDNLEQVEQALHAGADMILLDNMSVENVAIAVRCVKGKIPLEASGSVSLENVRAIAETGVDYISVGRLTHSAISVDIGLDID